MFGPTTTRRNETDPETRAAWIFGLCTIVAAAIEAAPELLDVLLDERDRRRKAERKTAKSKRRRAALEEP
jgi:hypothetical protein